MEPLSSKQDLVITVFLVTSLACSSAAIAGAVVSDIVVAVNPAAGEDGDRGGTFLGDEAILLW